MTKDVHYLVQYMRISSIVRQAIDGMNFQIKLLANKIWYYVILEYLLKGKDMKEVVSEMDIITTFPTQ